MKIDKRKLDLCRAKKCMTTKDLLKEAKVSSVTISKIGTKETKALVVGKLARALDVEPEDILADEW